MEDCSLYIEYIHLQTHSAVIVVGDRITHGQLQLVCCSGSIGFSLKLYLHLVVYRIGEEDDTTVRVYFIGSMGGEMAT